jgi:two-component system, sensor histidine kinase ChiS
MKQRIQVFIFTACALMLTIALVSGTRAHAAAEKPEQFDRAVFDTGTQNSGAILQDRDGFLWIGTIGAGLFRYDGYELKAYKPGGPNALSSPYVYALYEDRDGMLWIATGGGGLDRYNKETDSFTHYKHDSQNPQSISSDSVEMLHLQAIREDREGKLWIGTQNGLNVLDKATGTFKHYVHDPNDPNSLSHDNTSALLFDPQGIVWIGTKGGGLNRLDPQTRTFTRYAPDPTNPQRLGGEWVTSLAQDDEGMLWVATVDNGLYKLDRATEPLPRIAMIRRTPIV